MNFEVSIVRTPCTLTATGVEAAYELYRKMCEVADLVGEECILVDLDNGEIVEDSWDYTGEIEEDDEDADG